MARLLPHQVVLEGASSRSFPDFDPSSKMVYVKTRQAANAREKLKAKPQQSIKREGFDEDGGGGAGPGPVRLDGDDDEPDDDSGDLDDLDDLLG